MSRSNWIMSSIAAAGVAVIIGLGNRYMKIDPLFECDLNGDGRTEYIDTILFNPDSSKLQLQVYDGRSVSIRADGPYGRFSDAKPLMPRVPISEGHEISFSSRDVDGDGRMDAVIGQRLRGMDYIGYPITEEIGFVHHNGERFVFTFFDNRE